MFLTNPTSEELRSLDFASLKEMHNRQTVVYMEMLKDEGLTARTAAQEEFLRMLQNELLHRRENSIEIGIPSTNEPSLSQSQHK